MNEFANNLSNWIFLIFVVEFRFMRPLKKLMFLIRL